MTLNEFSIQGVVMAFVRFDWAYPDYKAHKEKGGAKGRLWLEERLRTAEAVVHKDYIHFYETTIIKKLLEIE